MPFKTAFFSSTRKLLNNGVNSVKNLEFKAMQPSRTIQNNKAKPTSGKINLFKSPSNYQGINRALLATGTGTLIFVAARQPA